MPSDSHAPIQLKVMMKIKPMIPAKQGIAVYLPVKKRSIAILRLCSLLSCGRTTVVLHRFSRKLNRMFASAASRSRPESFSMTDTI